MNKTLTALTTKLSWQLKEVNQAITDLEQRLQTLQQKLNKLSEQIHQACSIPAIIHPEQEIARLNFIIRSQQTQENLLLEKKEQESQQSQLQTRQLRLNTELKMLEKYLLKQKKKAQLNVLSAEQKEQDEWYLQKKESL